MQPPTAPPAYRRLRPRGRADANPTKRWLTRPACRRATGGSESLAPISGDRRKRTTNPGSEVLNLGKVRFLLLLFVFFEVC